MPRVAFLVGVDYYKYANSLRGCVEGAKAVKALLERHGTNDARTNFTCLTAFADDSATAVGRERILDGLRKTFTIDAEIALFYFVGHGHLEDTGGYLIGSDDRRGDQGLHMAALLRIVSQAPARNKVVILDCCHAGVAGATIDDERISSLHQGVTVLTSSTAGQNSLIRDGKSVFTTLLLDGLRGGAADLRGKITVGSLYAHIDHALGAFEQRPVFKTNIKAFVSIRDVEPAVSLEVLRELPNLFPSDKSSHDLDPTYEAEMKGRSEGMPPPVEVNVKNFKILQQYNRNGLVVPVKAESMWHEAMTFDKRKKRYGSCKLTVLGEYYRNLMIRDRSGD